MAELLPSSGSEPVRGRFRPSHRIRRSEEIRRVFAHRVSVADDILVVYGQGSGRSHPRLGLSVPKRVGSAVERNRWKRRIREAFRTAQSEFAAGLDLVVVPRGGSLNGPAIRRSLLRLAARLAKKLRMSEQ